MSSTSPLQAAFADAARAQAELDRRVFHLKTLQDAAGELAALTNPRRIMEHFLLTAMGVAGVGRGLVLLVNQTTGQGWVYHRGLAAGEAHQAESRFPELAAYHFPEGSPRAVPEFAPPDAGGLLPADMAVVIRLVAEEPYGVLAAFGACISGQAPDEGDRTALLHLTGVMINALRRNLFHHKTQHLHADMSRQAVALETARSRAGQAQARLERQVFNLRTIHEFTADASPVLATDRLLQRFVLTVMGALGVGAGLVLLCDRTARRIAHVGRGITAECAWTYEDAERHLYRGFQSAETRRLDPMSSSFVRRPAEVFPAPEMGFEVGRALLFTVDDTLIGLLALGPSLAAPGSGEEPELLQGLTASCMVLLKNARAFETIQSLNADLRRANGDLRRTIAELTEAHRAIRILEVARTRLRQAVQREIEQAGRLRLRDLVLMLLLAAGLALLFNASNPSGIPLLPALTEAEPLPWADPEAAGRMLAEGRAVLVDARPAELFQAGHLPLAINVPAPLFDIIYPMQLGRMLQPDQLVLVYGRTVSRRYDEDVARRLLHRHDHVSLLDDRVGARLTSKTVRP